MRIGSSTVGLMCKTHTRNKPLHFFGSFSFFFFSTSIISFIATKEKKTCAFHRPSARKHMKNLSTKYGEEWINGCIEEDVHT